MKKLNSFILSTIAVTILVGCGGGGGSSATNTPTSSSTPTLTGTFIDAPVEGLYYTSPTQSGYTNYKGEFTYKSGESITFKLGSLTLGSSIGSSTITPLEISGDTSLNSIGPKATNIARILQSVSENSDDSRIIIPYSIKDIDLSGLSLEADADITEMLTKINTITGQNKTLINELTAINRMKSNIQNNILGTYDGAFSLKNQLIDTSIFSCYKSGASSVNVTANGGNSFRIVALINGDSFNLYFSDIKDATIFNSNYKLTSTTFDGKTITGNYTIIDNNIELCSGTFNLRKRIIDDVSPVFTSPSSVSVNENLSSTILLHATDSNTVTYSIGGKDISYFNINPLSGEITFKEDPDYESKSSYFIIATAMDAYKNISTQNINIEINNLTDNPPVFSSPSTVSVDENQLSAITILANGSSDLSYTISGDDSSVFILNENVLTFSSLPDYENPLDIDNDNSYSFTISATDNAGNKSDQNVIININDLDEVSPVFNSSSSISVNENQTFVIDVDASDNYSAVKYSINGIDSNYFTIDTELGIIKFLNSPDYENPIDDGNNNTYNFEVKATDYANNSTTQDIIIQVDNITGFKENESRFNGLIYNEVTSPITGRIWLDRNLGASQVCSSFNDTSCYGHYYQWGREADGHQIKTSSTISLENMYYGSKIWLTTNDKEFAIDYPEWLNYNNYPDEDKLGTLRQSFWESINGESICPTGFKVPTITELELEFTNLEVKGTKKHFLKLSSSGYRSFHNGSFLQIADTGNYWSTSIYNTNNDNMSKVLKVTNPDSSVPSTTISNFYRTNGASVRCIKAE